MCGWVRLCVSVALCKRVVVAACADAACGGRAHDTWQMALQRSLAPRPNQTHFAHLDFLNGDLNGDFNGELTAENADATDAAIMLWPRPLRVLGGGSGAELDDS
jgi:hypothetical protein